MLLNLTLEEGQTTTIIINGQEVELSSNGGTIEATVLPTPPAHPEGDVGQGTV